MNTLLVLDNATSHLTCRIKDKIKECETALSVISNGIARRLQPLGISISKVIK